MTEKNGRRPYSKDKNFKKITIRMSEETTRFLDKKFGGKYQYFFDDAIKKEKKRVKKNS